MSRKKIKMADGVEYEFWTLTPFAVKDDRVKTSLAFLHDYAEGNAPTRIEKKVGRKEKEESRIDTMVKATQKILEAADNDKDRKEAIKMLQELNDRAQVVADEIEKFLDDGDKLNDQMMAESKFITVWMLQQEPNNLDPERAQSVVTLQNSLEPVKVILGFEAEEDSEVPAPLDPTATS